MTKNVLLMLAVLFGAACEPKASGPSGDQGVIEHDERRIGFEVAGRLKTLSVARGDRVQAGQVIAVLDDALEAPMLDARLAEVRLAQAQLELLRAGARREDVRAAQLQVDAANAGLAQLHDHLERVSALESQGAIARVQREDLVRQIASAEAQRDAARERARSIERGARTQEIAAAEARLDAARASLAALEARLSRFSLRAPLSGSIIDLALEPGEMAAAGAPVVTIADREHPFIEVFVPQGKLAALRIGMAARVRIEADPRDFQGRIEHISNRAEFTPRYLFSPEERPNLVTRVRVRFDDPDERAHAGVPAFVTFPTGPAQSPEPRAATSR